MSKSEQDQQQDREAWRVETRATIARVAVALKAISEPFNTSEMMEGDWFRYHECVHIAMTALWVAQDIVQQNGSGR